MLKDPVAQHENIIIYLTTSRPLNIYKISVPIAHPRPYQTPRASIPRLRTNIVIEAVDTSKTRTQNGLAADAAPEISDTYGTNVWSLHMVLECTRQW